MKPYLPAQVAAAWVVAAWEVAAWEVAAWEVVAWVVVAWAAVAWAEVAVVVGAEGAWVVGGVLALMVAMWLQQLQV